MKIPIDYDDKPLPRINADIQRLWGKYRIDTMDIIETSPGRYTVVLESRYIKHIDTALKVIQDADCDPHYKKWVKRHRDLTIRITRKNRTGVYPRSLLH